MDVLNEWLKTTILCELSDGLRWLDSSSGHSDANISHFEDDGRTLRAKVSKPGVVQITKLVTFEEPIQAWVSDSITRLLVTFAASAVRGCRYETRKRMTQDPLGGLIQIKDFEIVATHLGPRPYRVTILIKDFQSLGSVGSGGFGMPGQLTDLLEVRELLDRLNILRLEEPSKSHQEVSRAEGAGDQDSPSDTQSRIMRSNSGSSGRSRSASQENFATQVPRSRLAESSNTKALKSNGISRHGNSNDLPTSPNRPLISRPMIEKPLNAPTKVLKRGSSTLNANAEKSAAQLQPSDLSPKKPPARVKNQPKKSISATELLELLSKNQGPKLSRHSKSDATPVGPVVLRSEENDLGSASHDVRLEMDGQSEEVANLPAKFEILPEAQVSTSTVTTGVTPCIKLGAETNRNIETLNLMKPVANGGPPSSPGSSRISHREVKISKDQQALLDCSDSWIPAEPGQRQPVGNIPIAILQRIRDHVEGHLHYFPEQNRYPNQFMREVELTRSTSCATSESDSDQDTDPEIPISSGQWPPSSPMRHNQEELPPDSSMEAPVQTNEVVKEFGDVYSIRKRRKLSHSSTSSGSVISDSENPTTSSRRSRKIVRSSPALPTTPSRQDLRFSRPSGTETQEIIMEQRGLAKHCDKSDTHSATSYARTPNPLVSEDSIAAWQTCGRCHVQFHSSGILSHHEKFWSKETHRNDQDSDDFNFSQKVENPETLPVLFPETEHGALNDENIAEAVRTQMMPSTIPDQTEFKDHTSQQMINKVLTRGEVPPKMIPPENTNLIGYQPDFGGNSDSSNLKITPEISDQPSSISSNKYLASIILEQQIYPSTASGPEEAVLQVKATPYVNGHLYKSASADLSPLSSPSRKKNSLISDKAYVGKPNGMLPSPTVFETSSAYIVSSKPMEEIVSEFDSSEVFKKDSTDTDLRSSDQNVRGVAGFPSPGSACHVPMKANDITHVEETFISVTAPLEISKGECVAENPPTTARDDSQRTKRKFHGMQPISHEVAKRQKYVKSSTPHCSQECQTIVDPSTLGSKYQQEFYNSRKSSMVSLRQEAAKSPIMDSQASSPGSYTKCQSDGGLPGRKENSDAPLGFPPPKLTPVLKPDNGYVSEIIALPEDKEQSEDKEQRGEATLRERDQATKTGWSSNAITDRAEVQIIDQVQAQNTEHDSPATCVGSLTSLNVFDQFKATYPHYIATLRQFVAICRKIERLVNDEHMEHQYLWDDFIIRHKTEYPIYLNSCAEKAEDPLPYEQFYHNNIAKPLFTRGVVKPKNLSKVFFPNQQIDASSQQHPEGASNLGVENVIRRKLVKKPIISPTTSRSTPKPISPNVTVDLTSDNEASPTEQRQKPMDLLGRKSPRSLPWATSHKSQVENTPTRVISRTSSSSHISKSSLFSGPSSSLRPPKASGWVSSSPKKVAFRKDQGSESPLRAKTTIYDDEIGSGFHAVTQNQSFVPLLNQSDSVERLDLIYVADGQNSGLASYKDTKPNQDTGPRSSNVPKQSEHSRGNYSSRSQGDQASSKPFLPPQGTSKGKTRRDEQQEARVKDKNIPFGSFARAYAAIRNGNGNSYARDRESGNNDNGMMPENITPKLKRIDVLSWRL